VLGSRGSLLIVAPKVGVILVREYFTSGKWYHVIHGLLTALGVLILQRDDL
jgi:hypothetical protein